MKKPWTFTNFSCPRLKSPLEKTFQVQRCFVRCLWVRFPKSCLVELQTMDTTWNSYSEGFVPSVCDVSPYLPLCKLEILLIYEVLWAVINTCDDQNFQYFRWNCWNVLRLTTSPSLRTHSHPTILQPPRSVDRTAAFWRGIQIAPKGLVTWNVVMQSSNPMRAGLLSHIGRQVVLCQGPENFITFLKPGHNNLLWLVSCNFYTSVYHIYTWKHERAKLFECLISMVSRRV